MRFFKPLQITLCAALLCLALVPALKASDWDKTTIVTFSDAVQVPGQILAPGTYVFKLLDSPASRDIVQIFNADQTQLITTLIAIPETRPYPADEPIFELGEASGDSPQAVVSWFYPGQTTGLQFIYPENEYPQSRVNH
jgi:hypothetical protein